MKRLIFRGVLGALIAATLNAEVATAEVVHCEGTTSAGERITVSIQPMLSPGMPPELRYLSAETKLNGRWAGGGRADVTLLRTRSGLAYRERVTPQSFTLTLDAQAFPAQEVAAHLVLYRGAPYEARYDSLSCTVEGDLLYPLAPCPRSQSLIQRAFLQTARQGSARDLENILGCGADPATADQNRCTALHFVTDVNCGRPGLVGEVDAPATDPHAAEPVDHRGRGSLLEEGLIRLLGGAEASPNVVDRYGKTPLLNAVRNAQLESVIALLDLHANVNQQDQAGNTALMIAASQGDEMMVRTLLGGNADLRLTNLQGKTALDLANEHHHEHLSALLTPHAAQSVIKGKADGSCDPTMVHLTRGQDAEIVLEAQTSRMFLLQAPALQLELMAMPNGRDAKIIRPSQTGTFPFTCGVHGAPENQQTHGSFMVM